jgi:HYR domain-containing protein
MFSIKKFGNRTKYSRTPIINALLPLLLVFLSLHFLPSNIKEVKAQEATLQAGDLLVGAAKGFDNLGEITGPAIFRVRDGVATVFCEPGPTYFFIPEQVMVDSQGRVVFIAYLGSPYFSRQGYGLFRCDTMGATPELLAVFPGNTRDTRTPNPFPNDVFETMGSLYLVPQTRIIIDDNTNNGFPQIGKEDVYGMVAATTDPNTGQHTLKSLRYISDIGIWEEGPEPVQGYNGILPDMVYHAGITYSVRGDYIRRIKEPLHIKVSGKVNDVVFSASLSLFSGFKEISSHCEFGCNTASILTDDENMPNIDSGCNAHDNITNFMPYENGFVPMGGFQNVVFDEGGDFGLVITSGYAPLTPYLTRVSEALFNDDPFDDLSQYFHDPFLGCAPAASLHYQRILPFYSSDPATLNQSNSVGPGTGSLVSTSVGLMGIGNGRVVHIVPGDHVEIVNDSLISPSGIGAYPSVITAKFGTTIIIQINSPVNVLVTDPNGNRIGVDPTTGLAVNDFGENGFDSGPGEPRFLAIQNPAPGSYSVHAVGIDNVPFTINVFSADLTKPTGNRISVSGNTSVGDVSDHDFTLGTDTSITFNSQPPSTDTTPPAIHVPADGIKQEATGLLTLVNYDVTADDPDDSVTSLVCTPSSGTMLALGDTIVNCTAMDSNGNQSQISFHVFVQDTTPPAFNFPPTPLDDSLISVNATTPAGAVITFSTTATDLVDGSVTPNCLPESGNTFPINLPGEFTTVTCTAADGRSPSNVSSLSFRIHVKGAAEQLTDLATVIDNFNLKKSVDKQFNHKLDQVQKALTQNQINNVCRMLNDLISDAQRASGNKLTSEEANEIITAATRIRAVIGCQ